MNIRRGNFTSKNTCKHDILLVKIDTGLLYGSVCKDSISLVKITTGCEQVKGLENKNEIDLKYLLLLKSNSKIILSGLYKVKHFKQ